MWGGAGVFSHVAQQSLAPLSGRKRTKSSTWQVGFVWSADGWQRQRASDLPARALATGPTHYQTGDTRVTSNARRPELTVGRISPFLTVGVRGNVKCFSHCRGEGDGSILPPSQGGLHYLQSLTEMQTDRPVMGVAVAAQWEDRKPY